jgi:hypothetical protein
MCIALNIEKIFMHAATQEEHAVAVMQGIT